MTTNDADSTFAAIADGIFSITENSTACNEKTLQLLLKRQIFVFGLGAAPAESSIFSGHEPQ